ncbi:MAG: hypothetical protein HUK17_03625 [Bacteroidales bacterium]|nr:hypothetical protein [Bacteroidales bacterium]
MTHSYQQKGWSWKGDSGSKTAMLRCERMRNHRLSLASTACSNEREASEKHLGHNQNKALQQIYNILITNIQHLIPNIPPPSSPINTQPQRHFQLSTPAVMAEEWVKLQMLFYFVFRKIAYLCKMKRRK